MSSAGMEALRQEATRDLNSLRNDLNSARREMEKLGPEMEQELRNLIRQGIHTSTSIGRSDGNPLERRVSLSFEANTDSAKAYVERIPDIVMETADRLISQKIKKLEDRLQYYHEKALDADTFDSLVRLLTEWKNYASNLQIQVMSAKITVSAGDSLKTKEQKWREIAAKKRKTPEPAKQAIFFGGIHLSGEDLNRNVLSELKHINLGKPANKLSGNEMVDQKAQKKTDEQARVRAEEKRKEDERKQQIRAAEARERASFLDSCERKKNAFNQELADLEKKQAEEIKWVRDGITSWQTMLNGFGLFQFAGKRGAREEIEKLESELRTLPGTQRQQFRDKWDRAPADVRDAFLSLDMYSYIQEHPDCKTDDAKAHTPKNLGFSSISLAQKEEALSKLKEAKLIAEIPVNGVMVYRQVKIDSSFMETIESAKQVEQTRIDEEKKREKELQEIKRMNVTYKEEIRSILPYTGIGMTSMEILDAMGQPGLLTNQRVSALLRQLILDGLVEKETIGGKTYFRQVL